MFGTQKKLDKLIKEQQALIQLNELCLKSLTNNLAIKDDQLKYLILVEKMQKALINSYVPQHEIDRLLVLQEQAFKKFPRLTDIPLIID